MHDSCIVAVTCVSILAQVSTCPHIVVVLLRSSGDDADITVMQFQTETEKTIDASGKTIYAQLGTDLS